MAIEKYTFFVRLVSGRGQEISTFQKVRKRMTEHHMPPVKLYDIEAFYTDRGPDQVWDKGSIT